MFIQQWIWIQLYEVYNDYENPQQITKIPMHSLLFQTILYISNIFHNLNQLLPEYTLRRDFYFVWGKKKRIFFKWGSLQKQFLSLEFSTFIFSTCILANTLEVKDLNFWEEDQRNWFVYKTSSKPLQSVPFIES